MASSCELQAQVRFVEASPVETAACRRAFPDPGGQVFERVGAMEVWLPVGASEAARTAAMQALRMECDLRAALQRIQEEIRASRLGQERLEAGLTAVAQADYQLRAENEELRQLNREGYFKFALRVKSEDFLAFAVIMALGNRKAAADHLQVSRRNFYYRVERWATGGREYRLMWRYIEWRKRSSRHLKVRLEETVQSGDAGETPENPKTLREVLDSVRDQDSTSYPSLLRDILGALQGQNAANWPKVRAEVVGLIREEVLQ